MADQSERENEYDDEFVARLELIWGEGFLSPGGAEEVTELVENLDLTDRQVLDIGCGTGGADILLVEQHGAARVIGIDVEQPLIERARQASASRDLDEKLEFMLVDPGPLPFPDAAFDLVFSKDAILQIPDKPGLFDDVYRVLKPGGEFVASDWLKSDAKATPALQAFLDASTFSSRMETARTSTELLRASGFEDVRIRDRTAWLRDLTREHNRLIKSDYRQRAIEIIGADRYAAWLPIRATLLAALEAAELCPSHLHARKPDTVKA